MEHAAPVKFPAEKLTQIHIAVGSTEGALHTSAYVSIRQRTYAGLQCAAVGSTEGALHTSAYVSIRQHTSAYADVC
jgi:hypothetical protein